MSQPGNFTPISLYYSATATNVPLAANLVNGELALNIVDGKLFYKDGGGVVRFFSASGTPPGGANTQIQFNNAGAFDGVAGFTYTTGTSTLSVPTAIFSGTGAITTPNGTTAQRPATPALGMLRYNSTTNSFEGYGGATPAWGSIGGSGGGGLAPVTTDFTATAGQTAFTVSYTVGQLEVYRNGIKLGLADYTATNGTSFTLASPAALGDLIEAVSYTVGGVAGVSSFSGGTTGFTPSGTGTGAITLGGTLNVANGGTGRSTLTLNNVLLGNGTTAVQQIAPGAAGNVLTSDGTTWASTAPSGGGGGWVLIDTKTATGAETSFEFTGLTTTYKSYVLMANGISTSTNIGFIMQTGTGPSGGPTYLTSGYYKAGFDGGVYSGFGGNQGQMSVQYTTSVPISCQVYFQSLTDTTSTSKPYSFIGGNGGRSFNGVFYQDSIVGVLTALKIDINGTATFNSGTFSLYGITD